MMLTGAVADKTAIQVITGCVDNLLGIAGSVVDFITGNPLMTLCFSACLVGVGCGIVRRVKRTATR